MRFSGNNGSTPESGDAFVPPPLVSQSKRKRFALLELLSSDRPRLNAILFVATCLTTFGAGWLPQQDWRAGLWYSFGIISILTAHEMGHYLMCRKYGIQATLPFFIPFIPVGFGTLGAVIKMESFIPSRKALFDVAVAGPIAGFILTIPAIYFGAKWSTLAAPIGSNAGSMVSLGESILFTKLSSWAWDGTLQNKDLLLHPLAYAGWAGLLVTAMNLMPIGQLDGGHLIYALFGKHHRIITVMGLVCFGLVAVFRYPPWLLFLLLLLWFGRNHPPTFDERPLNLGRYFIGILALIIFVLSFTPEPIIM